MISSLDFLSSTGHARAITTTGVVPTTPQSWDDRYYTRAEVDALLSAITSQHAMDQAINQGLHTLYANQISAIDARITALEANAPTFKFNGGTDQPLLQLQVKSGDFPGTAYYNQSGIVKIAISTPPDADPY